MYDCKKLKAYQLYLKRPYWELREATALVRGVTEFGMKIRLSKELAKAYDTESYSVLMHDNPIAIDEELLSIFVTAIQEKVILANIINQPNSFECDEGFPLQNYTYLIEPYEFLAYAVTEGILLPKELQIASGLHHAQKPTYAKKNGWINEAKREAFAQICWYKNPNDNCSELTRKILNFNKSIYGKRVIIQKKLKQESQETWRLSQLKEFEFLYDSEKRTWDIANSVKPPSPSMVPAIPGLVQKYDNIVAIDFRHLKVVLNTIADLLLLKNPVQSPQELLSHPLIGMYTIDGGVSVEKVVKFILRNQLEILQLIKPH